MVSACLHGRCRRSHHYWGLQSPLTRTTYTYLYFGKQKTQRKAKKISNCFASHTNFHHVKYFKCSRLGHTTTGPKRPCLLKRSHDLPEKKTKNKNPTASSYTYFGCQNLLARICHTRDDTRQEYCFFPTHSHSHSTTLHMLGEKFLRHRFTYDEFVHAHRTPNIPLPITALWV